MTRLADPAGATGLLAGVRVLDFGIWRPVPYATQLLADLGADVLKVEPPAGDPMRAFPDLFATLNGHKRSLVLDLHDRADRARALELAAEADVVCEGFRPGVADRLGIGPATVRALNPSVVYCSLSGFGQTGPRRTTPGHDLNYQAVAGCLAPDGGDAPAVPALPWADLAGGLAAAFAICAALVGRGRTGEGEVIDLAMTDVLATWTGAVAGAYAPALGRRLQGLPAYGVFATADGAIALGTITERHFWDATCRALGLRELCGLPLLEQLDRADELRERLRRAIVSLPTDVALARLTAAGAPVSPVLDRSAMLADVALRERGTVVDGPDARPALAHPIRFQVHPAAAPARPPVLDAHRGEGFRPPDGPTEAS